MAQRVPATETNFFAIVIEIQSKAGGNLSEAIGNLRKTVRERKKMKGKIAAMSMEALASAAIIGAVPFIVTGALYVISPNYMSLLFTTVHGRYILMFALAWMSIGADDDEEDDQLRLLTESEMLDFVLAKLGDGHFMAVLLASIGCAATVILALTPLLQTDNLERRIKEVSVERERIRVRERERLLAQQNASKAQLRLTAAGMTKQIVDTFNLTNWLGTETAKQSARAGRLPRRGTGIRVPDFPLGRADRFLPVRADLRVLHRQFRPFADTEDRGFDGGAYIGIKAPEIYLANKTKKRQLGMNRAYPNMVDLLIICAESGMSIENAVRKVSVEIGAESIDLAEELSLLAAELSYLEHRRNAFENFTNRTGMDAIKQLTTVLVQAEKYGTPLGVVAARARAESREQRMQAAEKKAAALPPTLTVPMILFFLPGLFCAILGSRTDPNQSLELERCGR